MQYRVLIVHNETDSDRYRRYDPSTSRVMQPICELRFEDNDVTYEGVAERVYALANSHPQDGDQAMSEAYTGLHVRSLSKGDLLGILAGTGSVTEEAQTWQTPVWLSVAAAGFLREVPDSVPSSALPRPGLPIVIDQGGPLF